MQVRVSPSHVVNAVAGANGSFSLETRALQGGMSWHRATSLVAHDAAALEDLPFLPELSKVAEGPPPDSKAEESSSPGSAPGRLFDCLGFRGLGSRFGAML